MSKKYFCVWLRTWSSHENVEVFVKADAVGDVWAHFDRSRDLRPLFSVKGVDEVEVLETIQTGYGENDLSVKLKNPWTKEEEIVPDVCIAEL